MRDHSVNGARDAPIDRLAKLRAHLRKVLRQLTSAAASRKSATSASVEEEREIAADGGGPHSAR